MKKGTVMIIDTATHNPAVHSLFWLLSTYFYVDKFWTIMSGFCHLFLHQFPLFTVLLTVYFICYYSHYQWYWLSVTRNSNHWYLT